MKIVSLRELSSIDFELSSLFAMCQNWRDGSEFSLRAPRKSCGLVYLRNCRRTFLTKDGQTLDVGSKNLICLPAGSEYSVIHRAESTGSAYLVEFNLNAPERLTLGDSPFVVEGINTYLAYELISDAVKLYEAPHHSPLAFRSALYKLLDFLSCETRNVYNRRFEHISRGIELMDSGRDIPISEIAAACSVSENCFRRLFREYSGKSPLDYRLDLKLSRAKNMLADSAVQICDIASGLGFESSAYFCRLFRKKVGMTPSEFRESAKKLGI